MGTADPNSKTHGLCFLHLWIVVCSDGGERHPVFHQAGLDSAHCSLNPFNGMAGALILFSQKKLLVLGLQGRASGEIITHRLCKAEMTVRGR